MDIMFLKMTEEYQKEVMDIFNYYIESGFSAYPEKRLPNEFYKKFLDMTLNYPAYVIKAIENEKVIGFCFLRAYNPFPAFRSAGEISYFIDKDYVGLGLGKKALDKLCVDAKQIGLTTILANITSLNYQSLSFHKKNGFVEAGCLKKIGKKFGQNFDIILMQKELI